MNIHQQLNVLTVVGADWVLWFLMGLSITGLAAAIERLVALYRMRDDVERLRNRVLAGLRSSPLSDPDSLGGDAASNVFEVLAQSRAPEARVALAGLAAARQGIRAAEESMAGMIGRLRVELERNLGFLGTIGSNAPFVGLLGTVIGIIGAFRQLDGSNGQVTEGLMTEVGEALLATAVGILVAIPAVAFFNFFSRKVRARLTSCEAFSRDILSWISATEGPSRANASSAPENAAGISH